MIHSYAGHTLRRLLFRQQFATLNNNRCCIDEINVALWLRVPRFYYFVKVCKKVRFDYISL